ncbi:asparagine synthase-related protein [Mongoliitalea lutea]|uniref:asparagine synthase (glutamine-hydrolyzing) n=1 Tax=Mongoliitalea lutea TaxID=849756 RepID=A0A8J3CWL3_9BACT|nr:asparagine synthase-related protein [Mongoliitalea lutea]GHB36951.1 hypothetical protein GCM10008106_17790 [Mongoliitalea lutea]
MRNFKGIITLDSFNYELVRMPSATFQTEHFSLWTSDLSLVKTPDDRWIATGFCRIDNRSSLHRILTIDDGVSDLQVMILGFGKIGVDFLTHVIGDFSCVIYNTVDKDCYLIKDHIGIKPLFYFNDHKNLYFASDIPSLMGLLPTKPSLQEIFLARELKKINNPLEKTSFEGIKRLKPAHFLEISHDGKLFEKKYWDLQSIDLSFCKTEEDYLTYLRELFSEAIACRIKGKQSVGSQLSGGMDSSAITVLLSRLMSRDDLHTFSFVLNEETKKYGEKLVDEQRTQEAILDYANLNRANHHLIESFHYQNVWEELGRTLAVEGEITSQTSIWQDTLFMNAAKEGVEVMFSGFPGDEGVSFSGGKYYYEYLAKIDVKGLIQHFLDFRMNAIKGILNYFKLKKEGSFFSDFSALQEMRSVLRSTYPLKESKEDEAFPFFSSFREFQRFKMTQTHICLRCESEGLFANTYGIDMVYPLADIRLLEAVYSLPVHMFKPKPYNRAVFRNICKGILPDVVRLQPKFSGAKTLAFADYWISDKYEQLKLYTLKNSMNLLEEVQKLEELPAESELMKKKRIVFAKSMDYFIEQYLSEKNVHEAAGD